MQLAQGEMRTSFAINEDRINRRHKLRNQLRSLAPVRAAALALAATHIFSRYAVTSMSARPFCVVRVRLTRRRSTVR